MLPQEDAYIVTRELYDQMVELLGGRAAKRLSSTLNLQG